MPTETKRHYQRTSPAKLAEDAAALDRIGLAAMLDEATAIFDAALTAYEIHGQLSPDQFEQRERCAAAVHEAAARLRAEQSAAFKAAQAQKDAAAAARVEAFQDKLPYPDK